MFWLIYVTMKIENVLLYLGCRHGLETSVPLVNVIINNALFHSNSHVNQIIHICGVYDRQCSAIV